MISLGNGAGIAYYNQTIGRPYFILGSACTSFVTGINLNGNILSVNQTGTSYQWLDCTASAPIAGANNSSYTVTAPGIYAVVINQHSCSDTSDCFSVDPSVGLEEYEINNVLLVYPNPALNSFEIQSSETGYFTVINQLGEAILRFNLEAKNPKKINVENFNAGVYFIIGEIEKGSIRKKLLIHK